MADAPAVEVAPVAESNAGHEYDRVTRQNTHPADWPVRAAAGRYDLVVIGGGTAGLVASATAAILGARVALIEQAMLGGDCTHTGCVPSKALLRSARAVHEAREADRFGIEVAGLSVDFGRVMTRMRQVRAEISRNDAAERMRAFGVEVLFGNARFTGPDSLEVDRQPLRFRRAIIATGSAPRTFAIPGLGNGEGLTNETVFGLDALPRSLLVIGGGPVGCEMAQAFRRLGSAVTLVTDGDRLLPRDDRDASQILEAHFRREGIAVLTRAKVLRTEAGLVVVQPGGEQGGSANPVEAERVLFAVGRQPRIAGLNLEAAGVACNPEKGVRVDDHLRTTNRRIFAAGDVCSSFKFTHAAHATATLAVRNALLFGRKRASQLVIPWCTYTQPEVAHAGMGESEAAARPGQIEVFTKRMAENDRAVIEGAPEGFSRLYVDRRTRRVLGATVVGERAGDVITEAVLAIREGLSISSLSEAIAPYPTESESLKGAADAELLQRVKPWMRRWLGRYFQLVRG